MNTKTQIEKSPSLAEVKLKYKNNQPIESFPEITSPEKAEQVLREIWDIDSIQLKEEFVVLLLNNAKKLLGWSKISSGGGTATIVDPALIFQVTLLSVATSYILDYESFIREIEIFISLFIRNLLKSFEHNFFLL